MGRKIVVTLLVMVFGVLGVGGESYAQEIGETKTAISLDGTSINYYEYGNAGPTLVFVHVPFRDGSGRNPTSVPEIIPHLS